VRVHGLGDEQSPGLELGGSKVHELLEPGPRQVLDELGREEGAERVVVQALDAATP